MIMAPARELGWVEGRNLAIEYRWAEARTERCTAGLTRPTNLEAAPSYGRNGVGPSHRRSVPASMIMAPARELGWVEGRNLAIEYRWAEARTERCTAGLTRPTNLEAAPSYGRNGVWCSLSCELRMEHSP
jgi:hypothetical protein